MFIAYRLFTNHTVLSCLTLFSLLVSTDFTTTNYRISSTTAMWYLRTTCCIWLIYNASPKHHFYQTSKKMTSHQHRIGRSSFNWRFSKTFYVDLLFWIVGYVLSKRRMMLSQWCLLYWRKMLKANVMFVFSKCTQLAFYP